MTDIDWLKMYQDPEVLTPHIEKFRRTADVLERIRDAIRNSDFPALGRALRDMDALSKPQVDVNVYIDSVKA